MPIYTTLSGRMRCITTDDALTLRARANADGWGV